MLIEYIITCTHNPQAFFAGEEPIELVKRYRSTDLARDVPREIEGGYTVVITKARVGGE